MNTMLFRLFGLLLVLCFGSISAHAGCKKCGKPKEVIENHIELAGCPKCPKPPKANETPNELAGCPKCPKPPKVNESHIELAGCPKCPKPPKAIECEKIYVQLSQIDILDNQIYVHVNENRIQTSSIHTDERGLYFKDYYNAGCSDGFWECRVCHACNENYYIWCRTCYN